MPGECTRINAHSDSDRLCGVGGPKGGDVIPYATRWDPDLREGGGTREFQDGVLHDDDDGNDVVIE